MTYIPKPTVYSPLAAAEFWTDKYLDLYKTPKQRDVFKQRAFEALVAHCKEKNEIQQVSDKE